MSRCKQLSMYEQGMIDALFDQKKSISYISKKISRSRKVVANYMKLGISYATNPHSGCSQVLTPRKKRAILKMAKEK
ncbi:hypothetical protein ENBRE01_2049 [Enteropsectra breve]|nr:hypothetical protein ENBRE01_2049 [Enteropsectra breve]